jgi:HlyD family secretion protein
VARNVDVGQTVAASLQAPTIFNIAQDLTKMQLYAKTDESDVGRIKLAQEVTFKVDAYPKDLFHGTVSQKRMNATTVQNVVTYDTIIDFNNDELKLFPGMTAYVTIPVASVQKSLKVPNTALRFRPSFPAAEMRTLYAKYGIEGTASAPDGKTPPGPAPKRETAVVWKLGANKTLEPVQIELGITDHAYTEVAAVIKGDVRVDDNVVTASVESKTPQGPR